MSKPFMFGEGRDKKAVSLLSFLLIENVEPANLLDSEFEINLRLVLKKLVYSKLFIPCLSLIFALNQKIVQRLVYLLLRNSCFN